MVFLQRTESLVQFAPVRIQVCLLIQPVAEQHHSVKYPGAQKLVNAFDSYLYFVTRTSLQTWDGSSGGCKGLELHETETQ